MRYVFYVTEPVGQSEQCLHFCHVTVSVLCLFIMVPCVVMQCVCHPKFIVSNQK